MNPDSNARFRFHHPVEVRFVDLDAASHVHHSRVLVYFEEARWAYWTELMGWPEEGEWGFVLARAHVRWRKRIFWPQTLAVGVRVSAIGRRSFEMEFEVADAEGDVLACGGSTQVTYDFAKGRSIAVPEDLREKFTDFDGPFSSG